MLINKRYKDVLEQYIYKNEPTPLTIGTLAVCALCFLILIVATFTQTSFSFPWFHYSSENGFEFITKTVIYNPRIPAMIFIIYLLGRGYATFIFITYLITGLFIWPIFVFGGGLEYFHNYLFGYFLGFIVAIFITGGILNITQNVKARLLSGLLGVISIHVCGFIYCVILAIFRIIDFNIILPIANAISGNKISYDIIFSLLTLLIAPYIKNVFWICMKPKADKQKKLNKNLKSKHLNQV